MWENWEKAARKQELNRTKAESKQGVNSKKNREKTVKKVGMMSSLEGNIQNLEGNIQNLQAKSNILLICKVFLPIHVPDRFSRTCQQHLFDTTTS